MQVDVGVTLSGHLLSEELGRGGMSRVFRAEPVGGGAAVALKVALDPALVGALRAEGATLRRLTSPRFVRILEERLDADPPHFVLELCPGGDLASLARGSPGGRVPAPRVVELARDVLEGMAFAHDEGVVHGDLKPENILLDAEGRAKVADLGLSRAARASLRTRGLAGSLDTAPDRVRGTFDYLAPEVRNGGPITPASDVYALGVTLHELLVGERPHGLFRPPSDVLGPEAGVPPGLDRAIARALQPDPRERHPDAGVLLVDLLLGEASSLPPPRRAPVSEGANPVRAHVDRVVADSRATLVLGFALLALPFGVYRASFAGGLDAAVGWAILAAWAVAGAWLRRSG